MTDDPPNGQSDAQSLTPAEMTRDQLIQFVQDLQWAALDLSQHLSFTNDMLAEEHRPAAYKRAEEMAYALTWGRPVPAGGVAVFGEQGLTVVPVEEIEHVAEERP
jgi:hypothetical protein